MNIEGPTTGHLGVKIYLPCLLQGVGLNEVALVVHMEPMIYGVVLEQRHETCNVYSSQLALASVA